MKVGGGKAKGAEYERRICKLLSKWVSNGTRDDIFWRSAMSGGRATVQSKKGITNLSQVADITAIDPIGNVLTDLFIIECKSYRDLCMSSFFFNYSIKADNAFNFYMELTQKAMRIHKEPMLICKQNKSEDILITGADILPVNPLAVIDNNGLFIDVFELHNVLSIPFNEIIKACNEIPNN